MGGAPNTHSVVIPDVIRDNTPQLLVIPDQRGHRRSRDNEKWVMQRAARPLDTIQAVSMGRRRGSVAQHPDGKTYRARVGQRKMGVARRHTVSRVSV